MNGLLKFGLGLVALSLFLAPLFGLLVYRASPDVPGFPRVDETATVVDLTAGSWGVFVEQGNHIRPTSMTGPGDLNIEIVRDPGESYYYDGTSGTQVATVELPTDGQYEVQVAAGQTVAFAQGWGDDVLRTFAFAGLAVLSAFGFILGLGLSIAGYFQDR